VRRTLGAQVRVIPKARACSCVLLLIIAGCASHERRCEGKLEPINPPAPAAAAVQRDHGQ
jgi:hypothetical protein